MFYNIASTLNITLRCFVKQLGFPNGGDFGLASATLGLVFSVICGVMLVNIATHKGWVKRERIDTAQEVKISIRLVQRTSLIFFALLSSYLNISPTVTI